MGILTKKIKASTMMETLVATSIIIIVFVISSLVLNNTFKTITQRDTFSVKNRFEKLQYLYSTHKLKLPHQEVFEGYDVTVEKSIEDEVHYIVIQAKRATQKKPLTIYVLDEAQH